MTARISVALATHNGSAFIREQLRSILAQTRPVDEIIVSDDASRDDTVAIIEASVAEWASLHAPVPALRILRNEFALGVTANFEQALGACSGEIIALCDQDDRWDDGKIAVIEEAFRARAELELVHSDARIVDAIGTPTGLRLLETLNVSESERREIRGGRAIDTLLRRNLVTGATAVVSRGLIERARPFPASWVHDEWLAVIAASTDRLLLIEQDLIDYRQHGANQIGATSLTGSIRLARLMQPRTDRDARLLARAIDLAERLPGTGAPQHVVELAQDKVVHERVRSGYPRARLLRLIPVLKEWFSGRYRRFGLGAQDVLRDLIQPV
ncbi:hypothetical protein ASC66_02475 [Leifsonia sp. Root4]|uniref:glycosyltransferase family 2 protein n=1 Tax=Leifsonia sp. Root4 TaxID=1736525 RepID=UPI0006F9830B|nr:glycosyltransferase family 2 protein [Leifsonia sp. Root4]KQW07853.1 hypothetical protein ASC66_02475 [Leifsonia sp. Root4]